MVFKSVFNLKNVGGINLYQFILSICTSSDLEEISYVDKLDRLVILSSNISKQLDTLKLKGKYWAFELQANVD